jgi:hypothetical protein
MNRKVTVVGGAGNVGATVARAVSQKELADVVVVDLAETKAQGVALDIYQSCAVEGSASRVVGVGATDEGFALTADSDVVVITSGMPRKPGMSRDDLLNVNYQIMQRRDRADRQALAELRDRAGRQPARRHVAGGLSPERLPARTRDWHGRCARLGPHADLRRRRTEGVGRRRHLLRAGRPWRHHGAAAAAVHGGWHPPHHW